MMYQIWGNRTLAKWLHTHYFASVIELLAIQTEYLMHKHSALMRKEMKESIQLCCICIEEYIRTEELIAQKRNYHFWCN